MTRVARGDTRTAAGQPAAVPAGQHRAAQHAELRAPWRGQAVHSLPGGRKVFAGQRAEGFYVDLGSIFDLGTLRPFQMAHLIPSAAAVGVNGTQGLNVHTIAIQVPITDLTRDGQPPTDVDGRRSRSSASGPRPAGRRPRIWDDEPGRLTRGAVRSGRSPGWGTRCSTRSSCRWPRRTAGTRSQPQRRLDLRAVRRQAGARRAAAGALPGRLPEPGGLHQADRADLLAILLTGIPAGVVPGFQNFTGKHPGRHAAAQRRGAADRRTRTRSGWSRATPPASRTAGGSIDDVVDDRAAGRRRRRPSRWSTRPSRRTARLAVLKDGTTNTNAPYLDALPLPRHPAGGYQTTPGTPAA